MLEENTVKTKDGSNTLYSTKYKQHYHNVNDGAINESLSKHIIPTLAYHKDKKELNILDICFGLGYNTFSTLYYIKKLNLNHKVNIYSPEIDEDLVKSLKDFSYPKEFEEFKPIIEKLSKDKFYEDENIKIEVFIADARAYIKSFSNDFFDIVYQDAFSSDVNTELWTKQYFSDIYKICKKNCIISTYSIATPVRLSLKEAGFYIYEYIPIKRKSTLCFKQKQDIIGTFVDMDLKKKRNTSAKALCDI